jgi:hypothetical protein
MLTFGDITAPVAAREFLERYWERRAVLLRDPARSFGDYFDWAALNSVLNSGALSYPSTLASREERVIPAAEFTKSGDGKNIDVSALMALFRDGASFSIRGADAYWTPLKSIIACLYDTLFETVHTNVYCSPADTQGFRCHYDLHDVFVLQIEGAKHWRVFEPTLEAPVEPWSEADVPDEKHTRPYVDEVIRQGDVLYVPRGHWHYATAESCHSLHITVGITCRKADALLDLLGAELRRHHAWRRNVPLLGGPTPTGALPVSDEFKAWTDELRASLREALDDPTLGDRLAAELFVATAGMTAADIATDGDPKSLPIDQLVFSRPYGQRHLLVGGDGGAVVVRVAGTDMEFEGVSRALLARIFGPAPFMARDLATLAGDTSDADLQELLETLVRSGLLVARTAPAT